MKEDVRQYSIDDRELSFFLVFFLFFSFSDSRVSDRRNSSE